MVGHKLLPDFVFFPRKNNCHKPELNIIQPDINSLQTSQFLTGKFVFELFGCEPG